MAKGLDTNKVLFAGAGLFAAYMLFKGNSGSGAPGLVSTLQNGLTSLLPGSTPGTTYPYLTSNAPALPAAYNNAYYLNYIRPAMIAANSNVANPGYTLTQSDANVYMNNYVDVAQWANNATTLKQNVTKHTVLGALQYHWHTYGVPDQRSFLPLPWIDPQQWVPPPQNTKSSGGGIFGSILKAVTVIGGGILEVASAGALTPIVAPATAAALQLEGQIHGPINQLNDAEIDLIVTSGLVIKKILPFYLQVAPELVDSIEFRLDDLISKYAD